MKSRLLGILFGLAMNHTVFAQNNEFEAGIGISLTDMMWADERALEDSEFHYAMLDHHVTERWTAELYYAYGTASVVGGDTKLHASHRGVKGIYSLMGHRETVSPYFLFGLSELTMDESGAAETFSETGQVLGAGLKFKVSNRISMRVEANFHRFYESHDNDAAIWFGLSLGFGGTDAPVVIPKPMVITNTFIPPAPENISAPSVVAEPNVDNDADGAMNAVDKCPDTQPQHKVSLNGCAALTEKISMTLNIVFDAGKAQLPLRYLPEIENIANILRQYPTTKIIIEGHTDSGGHAENNKRLSQARADVIAASLVRDYGISIERISAVGYGQEKPLTDNTTVDGRAKNRRVTAEIEEQSIKHR